MKEAVIGFGNCFISLHFTTKALLLHVNSFTKRDFSIGTYNKITLKKFGPCRINRWIDGNAYQVRLPSHVQTSNIFNVANLAPYVGDASAVLSLMLRVM